MLVERYQAAVDELLQRVRTTQKEAIERAGDAVAECVASGGQVHLSEICHSIQNDLLFRGGGPIFYKEFKYNLNVNNPARERDRSAVDKNMEGLGAYARKAAKALPGDVLFLSSVSGRTAHVVDLAFEAKKMGITVVGLTSMVYAAQVDPVHSSGKKFHEICDIVLDNCAPAAEAMLDVPGLEAKFAAASGIASDFIIWSITSRAIEQLLEKGVTPGVLKSANFPGGNEFNKGVIEHYEKFGW